MQDEGKDTLDIALSEKIASLPQKPGVYIYKNDKGKTIYVGKAIKLRNRVRSYFNNTKKRDAKTTALVGHIRDLEFISTDSEAEALILEDTLIKERKPKYNVLLKDDKSYPYVRVTKETYPRVFYTRKVIKDGSRYFGPYTDVGHMKALLKLTRKILKIRSCDLKLDHDNVRTAKFKVCLDYHIKKCEGPCENLVSQIEYNRNINFATQILSGKTRELERELEKMMEYYAERMEFEKAAEIRNRLEHLRIFTSKQKIVSADMKDRDIFGLHRQEETACILILKIRDGKLIGKRHYLIHNAHELTDSAIIGRSMERWYLESDFIPDEIYLAGEPDEVEYLTSFLAEQKGKKVSILIPKIGDRKKLIDMANTNAKFIIMEHNQAMNQREQIVPRPVMSLQRDLRLKKPPRIIECFDNSHLQGAELVSSMVHFEDGRPKKSQYRRFKNREVQKNDDFAAMREAVYRRYSRLKTEVEEFEAAVAEAKANNEPLPDPKDRPKYPDLLVIDGGKGQLSSAMEKIRELGLEKKITTVGLAKKLEEVFFPDDSEPYILPKTSSSLRLLQQIRDEAHRFAITYHRQLRSKRTFKTELTDIPGIGKTIAGKLLDEFGSVANIKTKNQSELSAAIGRHIGEKVYQYFKDQDGEGAGENSKVSDE
ncbi:MAG: excinuclease ABC subunit UvrC [Candidatus Kapaibacteriales bacterium]